MIAEIVKNIIGILFLFLMPLHCSTGTKNTRIRQVDPEGYINLDIRMYDESDAQGFVREDKPVNDTVFRPVNRTMYIREHYLIDQISNIQTNKGQYAKSDTIGYEFYDLLKQQFARFDNFTPGAAPRQKGDMAGPGGSFSNAPELDPMYGIPDSAWHIRDTVMNGDSLGIVIFNVPEGTAAEDSALYSRTKFWVNYTLKNFPLQLSYTLSKKLNNAFVYKMQQVTPDGRVMMVTRLNYR